MPRGMKFPIKVSPSGGAVTVDGTAVVDQNIILAIRPAGSLHPWNQELAPDEALIFDIRDNKTGGLYTMHIREFFQEMERRGYARLRPGKHGIAILEPEDDSGDMVASINYENLETGKVEGIQIPITGER